MAVTSGFFNSVNGDRKYDAEQFGSIFEGIIKDGVYKEVGDAFAVTATSGTVIQVGTGRGWFRNTWIKNDQPITITLTPSDSVLPRYDYILIRNDKSDWGRKNSIIVLEGDPSTAPMAPPFLDTTDTKHYPIARVYRPGGSNTVYPDNIQRLVGSVETPWVIGALQNISISGLFNRWETEFDDWMRDNKSQVTNEFYVWRSEQMSEFISWKNSIQEILTEDVVGSLTAEIEQLKAQLISVVTENALFDELKDSSNVSIIDSYGSPITARYKL